MSAPCPPRAPTYYTTTLHVVAGISAPINILGLYLVIFKSLGVSKYKYCIFYIQAAAFLTEIQMSVVAPGYYFFPILGGFHTNELVAKLTSQNHLLMTIYLFFLGNEVPAVVWCFVYRHSAAESMRRDKTHSRIVKKLAILGSQAFPFLVSFCFYESSITREETEVYLMKNYPQCLYWLNATTYSFYDWRTNPWIAVTGIGSVIYVLIFFSYAFSLGFRTMLLLHELRSHMSVQTYRMHRTALIGLTLQVIIPSILLVLPLLICFWVIAFNLVEHQELATNSTVLICFHSVSSTIVMIAASPRYRTIVAEYFCKVCRYHHEHVVATVEPTISFVRRNAINQL